MVHTIIMTNEKKSDLTEFYYTTLKSKEEREKYCSDIDYKPETVRIHLIPKNRNPDRFPSYKKMVTMADKSDGKIDISQVISHFDIE